VKTHNRNSKFSQELPSRPRALKQQAPFKDHGIPHAMDVDGFSIQIDMKSRFAAGKSPRSLTLTIT
jgi:hypothetical protein